MGKEQPRPDRFYDQVDHLHSCRRAGWRRKTCFRRSDIEIHPRVWTPKDEEERGRGSVADNRRVPLPYVGLPGGTMGRLPDSSPIRTSNQAGVATSLAKQGLAAKPGTKYAYTFRGFAAAARCVEVVTGKRFPEILEEKLLKPLGMSNTTFQPDLELLKRHPRYAKHIANLDDEKISAFLEKKKRESKRFVNAAGGLISTPGDLVKFYRLHSLRGKIVAKHGGSAGRVARDGRRAWQLLIPAKVIAKLYEKQPGARGYGLGFKLFGNAVVGHGGASGTIGAVDLKNDRVVVILTQAGATAARPLTRRGMQLAREILAK